MRAKSALLLAVVVDSSRAACVLHEISVRVNREYGYFRLLRFSGGWSSCNLGGTTFMQHSIMICFWTFDHIGFVSLNQCEQLRLYIQLLAHLDIFWGVRC